MKSCSRSATGGTPSASIAGRLIGGSNSMPLAMMNGSGYEGGINMKVKVQIIIEQEGFDAPVVEEVACLYRGDLLPATLGLTLEEGKELLARIQETMVAQQAASYVEQQRPCPDC